MTTPAFKDWIERRNNIRETFPDDLLEDLKDEEPELYQEAQVCDENIIRLKNELENSVSPIALLPSLLTEGWDRPRAPGNRSKNWPDMENLLKLYAIGLYFKNQPLTQQALHDQKELSDAAQKASISKKHKKGLSAQTRFQRAKTYLRFGMKTLDIFFQPNSPQKEYDMSSLDAEIYDTTDYYNSEKLRKSKNMALRVGRIICNRYKD